MAGAAGGAHALRDEKRTLKRWVQGRPAARHRRQGVVLSPTQAHVVVQPGRILCGRLIKAVRDGLQLIDLQERCRMRQAWQAGPWPIGEVMYVTGARRHRLSVRVKRVLIERNAAERTMRR